MDRRILNVVLCTGHFRDWITSEYIQLCDSYAAIYMAPHPSTAPEVMPFMDVTLLKQSSKEFKLLQTGRAGPLDHFLDDKRVMRIEPSSELEKQIEAGTAPQNIPFALSARLQNIPFALSARLRNIPITNLSQRLGRPNLEAVGSDSLVDVLHKFFSLPEQELTR